MAGGWPGPGSLSFRLSHALGASSLPRGLRRAVQGDAGLADDGLPAKPRKSARFPLKAAITASVLATTGDTLAQLFDRYKQRKALEEKQQAPAQGILKGVDAASALINEGGREGSRLAAEMMAIDRQVSSAVSVSELIRSKERGNKCFPPSGGVSLWDHDWLRAARMASYGFLIYGPLSQVWYEVLDHFMPVKNLTNLSLKVAANQVILGPIVITLVFAWNKLWEGRLEQLPGLYRTRAVQALMDGWKFWIPASVLNFGLVPLQARVAFMSSCSIFWNFYLSNTMTASKAIALPTSKSE